MPNSKKTTKNGGNGRKNGRYNFHRDNQGLTEKQRIAIPIISKGKTIKAGVRACEEQGIVSVQHYYRCWNHEKPFKKALLAAREAHLGSIVELVQNVFRVNAEELAEELVSVGLKGKRDKVAAITRALHGMGVDLGGTKINVTQNLQTGEAKHQESFSTQLERELTEQEQLIEEFTGRRQ